MFVPADVWYCCLTPNEQAAVIATAALFTASIFTPIERSTFESVWSVSTLYQHAGIEAVLYYYGLEETFIVIPDAPPVPAIGVVNVPLWLDVEGFMLSGQGTCGDGCDEPVWSR